MNQGVRLAGLGPGVLQDPLGNVIAARGVYVLKRDAASTTVPNQVQVYSDEALTTPVSQPLLSDANGVLPGYVAPGQSVDLYDSVTTTRMQAEALLASAVANTVSGASAHLVPSGGDDSAAMVTALTSFAPFTSPFVVLGPGTFQWNTSVPALLRSTPTRILGAGMGQTIIQLSTAAPRAFDFNKVADYDTFSQIELTDFTVDCNGVTGSHHVILGTLQNGTFQTRINVLRSNVKRVRAINVPVSATGAYQRRGVSIVCAHAADNEATQDTLTDILCEDVRVEGGAYGLQVAGTSPGNVTNVKYDRVRFVRCYHDTGVIPTAAMGANGANFFIGSGALGGSAEIHGCYGANSCDVGIETDNATTAYIDPTTEIVDAWNAHFFTRNFRAPADLAAQTVEFNGIARSVNVDPAASAGLCNHFLVGGDSSTAAFVFGHLILGDCRSVFESALASPAIAGLSVALSNHQVRRVTLRDFTVAAPNMSINPAGTIGPCFVDLRSSYATANVRIENLSFVLGGTRSGVSIINWKMVRVAGTVRLGVKGISMDIAGLAGLGANDTFYWLLLDDSLNSTITGDIRGIKALSTPSGGTHNGVFLPSTATLTVPGMIEIDACDLANLPAAGTDYNINATQAAKVNIRGYASARTGVHGPLQVATAITPGASPYTYTNADSLNELVTVAGGTVSAVVLNAGGNVTVANAGTYLLRPGDTLTVTYTAAPTMTKTPAV